MKRKVILGLAFLACLSVPTAKAFLEGQVGEGAEIFAFYCSTCHAADGQGLTPEWRATWDEEHQNCWKPACHGPRHPDTGFQLPRQVPALIGQNTLAGFPDGYALYAFIRDRMPYQHPGLLEEDEYWAVTAFLLHANGANLSGKTLDAGNAASVQIKPGPRTLPALPAITPAPRPSMDLLTRSDMPSEETSAVGPDDSEKQVNPWPWLSEQPRLPGDFWLPWCLSPSEENLSVPVCLFP